PVQELLLARLRNAPPFEKPLPLIVTASAIVSPEPLISMPAPEVTVLVPVTDPRAAPDCTWSTPVDTVVAPEYVLVPDSASTPVPLLVSEVALTPSAIDPEKVVKGVFSAPVVRVAAEPPVLVTVPAPASEPTASPNALRSNVAPFATVNALADP